MFHPHALQPGEVFADDFRIERPLAMGGMGAVYVAEQLSTGRKRALKLLLPSLVENLKTRERFEQEARVASRINSDHVVEVVGAGVDAASGAPWLAMELLEGETLTQRLERAGPMRPAEAIEVFKQLCHALAAAHANGLVHRDIKPDNVYLAAPRREGIPFTLKILDFGIAKLTEDVRSTGSATGAIGSPLWMAPEQTDSSGVGPPADVWALGLVAFFCLTGRNYWRSASGPNATLQGLLREVMFDPLDPASVRATELGVGSLLPAGFDGWFAHTVVREPAHRYQDAAQALAALHPVLNPLSPTLALDAYGGAAAQTLPSNAPSVPAAFSATAPTAIGHTALAAQPQTKSSSALKWVVGGLALVLVAGVFVVGVAGLAFGYYFTAGSSEADTAASATGPTGSPPGETPAATGTGSEPAAVAENAPAAKRSGAQASPSPTVSPTQPPASPAAPAATSTVPAAPAATATASSTAVAMNEVSDHPARDYKLSWYKQKITECWKGNEGAKPDAGSYSCTVTVKLTELGQATSIIVSPRTYKYFAGCAVVRSSEHPWGKGPPETKSFSFSF